MSGGPQVFNKAATIEAKQALADKASEFGCAYTINSAKNDYYQHLFDTDRDDPDRLASITCHVGAVAKADGSASIEYAYQKNRNLARKPSSNALFGEHTNENLTAVLVSVMGPGSTQHYQDCIDRCTIQVKYDTHHMDFQSIHAHYYSVQLTRLLEAAIITALMPRASLEICVQTVHNAGGLFGATVNALCLALLHTGIPLKNVFAGVTVCIDAQGGLLADPSLVQESSARAVFYCVFYRDTKGLLFSDTKGSHTIDELSRAINFAHAQVQTFFGIYTQAIQKYYRPLIPN